MRIPGNAVVRLTVSELRALRRDRLERGTSPTRAERDGGFEEVIS